jgi:signal transduction histidine kinase
MTQIAFNVSARTARLIGQENFANPEGAIIELVKNAYDADASKCIVFVSPIDDCIYIIDNGEGMTQAIIEKYWMTIGTDNKKETIESIGKRVKTGAKGIGRFALDRLGRNCEMRTRMKEAIGVDWKVDWTQFEQSEKKITEISADLDSTDSLDIISETKTILSDFELASDFFDDWIENKGTIIRINDLKDVWAESSVSDLNNSLQVLAPPLETSNFHLYLFYPNAPKAFGLVNPTECEDYDYRLAAIVNADKSIEIKVYRNELSVSQLVVNKFFERSTLGDIRYSREIFEKDYFTINTSINNLLPGLKDSDAQKNIDKIGEFKFNFYFIKRGEGQEKDEAIGKYPYKSINEGVRKNWLNLFGGIKIFRDHFRVRPYGEPKGNAFDWLDLGKRAVSNPTVTRAGYRVRPTQVYGVVNISRIYNQYFDDKSGREGIQENEVFTVFKELLKAIINVFENDRNQIMMTLKKIYDERNKKEKAKAAAKKKIENKKAGKSNDVNQEALDELLLAIEGYEDDIDDLVEEQKLLRVLASTGLIVTSFAHELKNLSDRIVPRTDDLVAVLKTLPLDEEVKTLPDFKNPYVMLTDMRNQDERLRNWLEFALSSVRNSKRMRKEINLVTYIEELQRLWSSLLKRRQTELIIETGNFVDVKFKGHEIDLDSIFNNLIANSSDAFKRKDADTTRIIRLSFVYDVKTGINVTYEDTGPGLSDEITDPNVIYQPFFTTKRDERTGEKTGTGLGMWIVKSTIENYNGGIEIINTRPNFKLKLNLPHGM